MASGVAPILAVAGLAFAGATLLRIGAIDRQAEERRAIRLGNDVLHSPGKPILHLVTAEHRLAFADLAWLDVVQHVGAWAATQEGDWDRIEANAEIATDLDPLYYVVYESAATVMAVYAHRIEPANALLEKGYAVLPNDYRLPFLIAYNDFFLGHDPLSGAEWMAIASKLPRAPRYLPALAGRMRFASGDENGAIEMLEQMLPTLEGVPKQDAEWRLVALRSEPRLRHFDEACERYRLRMGVRPKTGQELVDAGDIREEPVDLFGKKIVFDGECTAQTEEIKAVSRTRVGASLVPSD